MFEIVIEPWYGKSYMLINKLNNQKIRKFFKSEKEAEDYALYLLDTYTDEQLSSNWYLVQENIRAYVPPKKDDAKRQATRRRTAKAQFNRGRPRGQYHRS